jgi:hypothetical protein
MLLQAVVALDEELAFGVLEPGVLERTLEPGTLEPGLDLIDELEAFNELALEAFNELTLDLMAELELALLEVTPVPFVGIEHSFVALAGLGSIPKVVVLHTKVPLSTL